MRRFHGMLLLGSLIFLLPSVTWSQNAGRQKIVAMLASDPEKLFDSLSGGGDVVVFSSIPPQQQRIIRNLAERFGFTLGDQMTRSEFRDVVSGFSGKAKQRDDSNKEAGASNVAAGGPGGTAAILKASANQALTASPPVARGREDARVERFFRNLDVNKDGVLSHNEIPEDWQREREIYDKNADGLIDLDEFKTAAAVMGSKNGPKRNPVEFNGSHEAPAAKSGGGVSDETADKVAASTEPAGMKASGIPEWFTRLDENGDCDGQIGLWEARNDKNVLAKFAQMDLNGDGLITRDEILRFNAMQGKKARRSHGYSFVISPPKSH